jgi:SAM-dependent methyltransferase
MTIPEISWMLRNGMHALSPGRQLSRLRRYLKAWGHFWESYRRYCKLVPPEGKPPARYLQPCIGEDTEETEVEPIYYYQDSWAFEKIVNNRPSWHVDVGSHHTFVSFLSKILPVFFVDIRPPSLPLDTLQFQQGSILALPFRDASVPSLSSLCVIEHIGLGRYGEPLDAYGSEKAIRELKRVVMPGGDLYLSFPLDDEDRTYFNAHRAFREENALRFLLPFHCVERRYIYGKSFLDHPKSGFGTGCYHLRRPG